jgi:FRG domain
VMVAAAGPQESPRITPRPAQVDTEGRAGGVIVWNTTRVEDSRPLEKIQAAMSGSSVAFRGYSVPPKGAAEDALLTGLDRLCIRIGDPLSKAPSHETTIIREFRRRVHHYLPGALPADNSLELLALMQHHGAPTRLLDWTYSLYVAAHFALTHASRRPGADLAIWMIRPDWCRDASKAACEGKEEFDGLWKPVDSPDDDRRAGMALLSGRLPRSIWALNPFRLNERLTIQRGLFLAPGDVTESFGMNLSSLKSGGDSGSGLTRYVVPRSLSRDVAQSLYDMNVTETTLFPGLDGFARSLWFFPELPQGGAKT